MAGTSPKKGVRKSPKKTAKPRASRKKPEVSKDLDSMRATHITLEKTRDQLRKLGDKFSDIAEKKDVHDVMETTRVQLRKLGIKLHDATDKGIHVVKEIAEEVHRFSHDATELTKLKIEIHHLKSEHNKLLKLMGERLRNLHKANMLRDIHSKFSYDFQKLDELEENLARKEKEAEGFSLDIKTIK
jgi:hypothetical protein